MAQPPNYNKITAELILDNLLSHIEEQPAKEIFPTTEYDQMMGTAFFSKNETLSKEKALEVTKLFLDELNSI